MLMGICIRRVSGAFNHTLFGFLLLLSGGLITSNGPTNFGNNFECVYFNRKFLVESNTRSPSTSGGAARRFEVRAHSVRNLVASKTSRKIADTLLKKGTKQHANGWDASSKDWAHMVLHLPHAEGGFSVPFN
jgi:hypothetical protein